jgi:hypothetical protein
MSEERYHTFHAQAGVLHGRLQLPLVQEIKPQAFTRLQERGGYLSQHAHNYQLEGIASYRTAYTQVAGNPELDSDHGWTTVATSVVEHLNVLDVLTADRVVAQIKTDYPVKGYVPSISFLGTRFENLRIAGHPVKLEVDHGFFGPRANDDSAYTGNKKLLERIAAQAKLAEDLEAFPHDELDDFNEDPLPKADPDVENPEYNESIECSLVNGAKLDQADDTYPGKCFNHVIDVPNFGKIYLASLRLKHEDFQKGTGVPKRTTVDLSMVKLKMGSLAAGKMSIGNTRTNGGSHP